MADLEQALAGEDLSVEQPIEQPEAPEVETPEAPPETPPVEEKSEHHVPLPVFMDMKNEVKALRAQLEQQGQPQDQAAPEFLDPEGATFMQQQMQAMYSNMQAEMSESMSRTQHGDQTVDAALQAAQAAGVVDQFRGGKDPWGKLVKWHKDQQVSQEIGGDLEGYRAKLEAEIRSEIQAEMAAKQVKDMAAKPAPSMADVTGTGGGPKTAYAGPTALGSLLPE